jgi:hypothetical protein
MPDVVNSSLMPDAQGTTTTSKLTPGAAAPNKGQSWPPGQHDSLKLPDGKLIGQTDTDTLRRQLAKIGVEGAHSDGRHIIAARYAALLQKLRDDAGNAAVDTFLANHRG